MQPNNSTEYEATVLAALRPEYESKGYRFIIRPNRDQTPTFLGTYQPDAIALSDKENIVIEVKSGRTPETQRRISQIARLVENEPGWRFRVYYGETSKPLLYERPSKTELQHQLQEAKALAAAGHVRAAFIIGWAALEALARTVSEGVGKTRAMMPRELVGWLAQEGHIDSETRRLLRDLVSIRNAVVHGSTEVQVKNEQWVALEKLLTSLIENIEAD